MTSVIHTPVDDRDLSDEMKKIAVLLGSVRHLRNLTHIAVADPEERLAHDELVHHAERRVVSQVCTLIGYDIKEFSDMVDDAWCAHRGVPLPQGRCDSRRGAHRDAMRFETTSKR